jgi:ribosomal protein L1
MSKNVHNYTTSLTTKIPMKNMPNMIQELKKGMIQVHMDHPPTYNTELARQDIQDHKIIMNKLVSLPLFIQKNDTITKHAISIQVSTIGKRKTHYSCVQRLSRDIESGVENQMVY